MFNEKFLMTLGMLAVIPFFFLPIWDDELLARFGGFGLVMTYIAYVWGVVYMIYGGIGSALKVNPYLGNNGKRLFHSAGPIALLFLFAALEKSGSLGMEFMAWMLVYLTLPLSHYWLKNSPTERRWFLLFIWTGVNGWMIWSLLDRVGSVDKLALGWGSLAVIQVIWLAVAIRQFTFKDPAPAAGRPAPPTGPDGSSVFQPTPTQPVMTDKGIDNVDW